MRLTRTFVALGLAALLSSCGGSDGGPSKQVLKIEKWPPSGDNQTDTAGRTLAKVLRVKVTINDNVVPGYMVHFSGGTLGTDSALSDVNGIVTSTWTLGGAVGTQFVTATLDSAEGSPLTFHATAVAGAPAILAVVSGSGQIVVDSSLFGAPLVVKLTDQFGNGVAGRFIQFSAGTHVQLGADSIITNDQGRVSLNLTAISSGPDTVVATFGSVTGSPLSVPQWVVPAIDTVIATDVSLTPANLNISRGSAVLWRWASGTHQFVADSGGVIPPGGGGEATTTFGPVIFSTAGKIWYHDALHPGVTGVININ